MGARRASVWIPGDQLLLDHPAIAAAEAAYGRDKISLVLIESQARLAKLPYHRRKSVLVLSAMRHFAQKLRELGYRVDYLKARSIDDGLAEHLQKDRPGALLTMAAAEYDARRFQTERLPSRLDIPVEVLPNTQFLTGQFDPYPNPDPTKRVVMENFYREMRRHFRVLIEPDGQPTGGKWNYDEENRKPLPKTIPLPPAVGWEPDEITRRVIREVDRRDRGYGVAEGFRWAVTHEQAREALDDFIAHRLADFGPYEDAMTTRSAGVFHSLLSAYVNLGLLDPLEMIRAAEKAYREGRAPINSVEGFIRQILGWREFIYWQYWRQMPELRTANRRQARRSLPAFFWNAETDMNCLRHVVQRVIDDGYSHHIERLMIVCNFCLLAGIEPRQVADWFLAMYVDAYDWVVLPNVIGMGLNADGGKTATKPYLASANYIGKMSDYCGGCRYDAKQRTGENACPFNFLYWNFLQEHEKELRANPRLGPAVLGLGRIGEEERGKIRRQARQFLA